MPELPEAETIVRELKATLPGRRIGGVEVIHPDLIRGDPSGLRQALEDTRFRDVARRGKNVLLHLGSGETLVVNLGMSGRLLLRPPGGSGGEPSHPGIVFHLEGGGRLVYHDVRRFGRLEVQSEAEHRRWSRSLGPEPLAPTFTARRLEGALARSRSPLRSWLLDQRRIAGVGNIYANEALHRARLHPGREARSVGDAEVRALHRAIRRVLREAIRARGTTLRDYRTAAGDAGAFALRLRVYGRGGEKCPRCPETVRRTVLSNRSAFFCPGCQR